MGCGRASPALLSILNTIQIFLGLALTAAAIWFFIEVQHMTSLRNPNRYLLDYNIYWPQAIPWLFLIIGVLILSISSCGICGSRSQSKCLISTYVVFEVILILVLICAAALSSVFALSDGTDKFIGDTISDVYQQSKSNPYVRLEYEDFEMRYHCCGCFNSRDYVHWLYKFPKSCCGGAYDKECDTSSQFANEMIGCSKVAVNYTKKAIHLLATGSIVTAFIGIINVIFAVILYRYLKRQDKVIVQQYEAESEKVLLH